MGTRRLMRKLFWLLPLAWLVWSLVLAGTEMKTVWDFDPHSTVHDLETGEIHWLNWLSLGLGWFLMIGIPPAVLLSMLARAVNKQADAT